MNDEQKCVRITIVIAVLNMESTVERAILSVLNQTYDNKELIIMDGGSTDGTVSIIRKYENRLAYWTSAKDNGPSDAISKALPYASGALIGFLGADDWYEPYALEMAAAAYDRSNADLCYGNMVVHSQNEAILKDLSKFRADRLFLEGTQWLGAVCAFAKKELLEENYTKKNDVLLTDYLFFLRLYADGKTFAHIGMNQAITHFFIGGRTTTQTYRVIRDTGKVREQFLEEYPQMKKKYAQYTQMLEEAYAMGLLPYYKKALGEGAYRKNIDMFMNEKKTYVLFGGGHFGSSCAKLLHMLGVEIYAVVDNNETKWGKSVEGIKIQTPDILKTMEGNCVVITPSLEHAENIRKQLAEMGVDRKNSIVRFADIAIRIKNMLGEEMLDDAYEKGLIS